MKVATGLVPVATIAMALSLGACVTPRHIDELRAEVREVKVQAGETMELVASIDSTSAANAEHNRRAQLNLTTTADELRLLISQLLESNSDILKKLDDLSRRPQIRRLPPTSSPGAQTDGPTTRGPNEQAGQASVDCANMYDEAFITFRQSEYKAAATAFGAFLSDCGQHELAENAEYWIGECYYSMEKHSDAIAQFEKLLKDYRDSANLGRALYKIARSHEELGHKKDARKYFQQLVDDYPGTLEAQQASERLKDLK